MTKDEVDKVLELLYQRLLKKPKTTALTLMSYSTEKLQQSQQALENLKENHQGEFVLASEEQNEVEEILTKQINIPKLTINTKRISTPAEAGRQLDSLRILIDWETNWTNSYRFRLLAQVFRKYIDNQIVKLKTTKMG